MGGGTVQILGFFSYQTSIELNSILFYITFYGLGISELFTKQSVSIINITSIENV